MVRAVIMTWEQAAELVDAASDGILEEVTSRELKIEKRISDAAKQGLQLDDRSAVFDPPQSPTLEEIAAALIRDRYGAYHNFDKGTLVVALRRAARLKLGLPV